MTQQKKKVKLDDGREIYVDSPNKSNNKRFTDMPVVIVEKPKESTDKK